MKKWFAILLLASLLLSTIPAAAATETSLASHYGRMEAALLDMEGRLIGTAEYWNNRPDFLVDLAVVDDWKITSVQVYAGMEPPPLKKDKPVPGNFPCVRKFSNMTQSVLIQCDMVDEFAFKWGTDRSRHLAIHGDLVKLDAYGVVIAKNDFWVYPQEEDAIKTFVPWPALKYGGYFTNEFVHPKTGHFIDSPVAGLTYRTPTSWGTTDASGAFDYFPGERVDLWLGPVYLGNPIANQKISPMDIFEGSELTDVRVVNMARLLQSLDADGSPQAGINITTGVTACLSSAMMELDISEIDFGDGFQVDDLINGTLAQCASNPEVTLVAVSAEDAIANLDRSTNGNMFRKNISRTPNLISSKSKLDIMAVWFPAHKADGSPTSIEYYDENGNLLRTANDAKPVVVTYTDSVPETGAEDIFAAISRDDGNTFKRMNLSRAADKSSFTLANGQPYYGEAKKPVVQVKNNNILIAWTSKFCNGGKPAYAIDPEDDYIYDDPYYTEDIWGVAGPQRSVDYTEQGFPEVGEVPFSCVWVARGTVVTQAMINSGGFWADRFVGEIVWFKPERLTSGRRDALQIFAGGADGAGFAIVWQEDPDGLRPGKAVGPGEGWSGATTNHKTDIWYSYITMNDFRVVDGNFIAGGDPQHEDPDLVGRPKALVPMSLPMRLSDNDVVNTDNLMVELGEDGYPVEDENGNWIPVINPDTQGDGDGTHAYGYKVPGLCESFHEFTNQQDALKRVCVTADGRLLDGDTGASRPNLNLQTYTNNNGTPNDASDDYKSAWAIVAYEETKGLGGGSPDHDGEGDYGDEYVAEEGKNVIYHSFEFRFPEKVSAGYIVNLPERDADGNLVYLTDEEGNQILDWQGLPQTAYENARRPRFIMQGKSGMGASRTVMVIVYKDGVEGSGRPSDIMLRRMVVPSTDKSMDNPYRFSNLVCTATAVALNGETLCVGGAQNLSTVTPTVITESQGDPQVEDPYGAVKVVQWVQTPDNLDDPTWLNPYEDARAHRGDINGDFLVIGYTYTPNWAAYRNGNDKYDFYVRRSYDGGQTWTTDPNGQGVTNCDTFTDPVTKEKTEVCKYFGPGQFEQARNLSQLPNNKSTVIEPRIVAPPGTIKNPDGSSTGKPEDINNPYVYYVSYGTATNPPKPVGNYDDEEDLEITAPMDLYYSFTTDLGESYVEVAWNVNPDSLGNYAGETVFRWDYLAKGDPEQGEAQLRMTPDGSRLYATWLQEGLDGSDIWFRRVMSPAFPANVAP
jgi:hypothetical protein